jgi:O-antigen ligase
LVLAILFAGGVLIAAPDQYWDEIRSIGDMNTGTADTRFTLWKVATRMYLHNPIFGVGPGNFPWNFFEYRTQELADRYTFEIGMNYTHSFYFELIAEMGTVGLLTIAGLIYFNWRDLGLVKQTVNLQRELVAKSPDRLSARTRADHLARMARMQAYANGLAAAFLGFFVASAFVSTLHYTTFWILTGVTMALRLSVTNEARGFAQRAEATQAPRRPPPRSSVASFAAATSPNTGRASVIAPRRR